MDSFPERDSGSPDVAGLHASLRVLSSGRIDSKFGLPKTNSWIRSSVTNSNQEGTGGVIPLTLHGCVFPKIQALLVVYFPH